MVHPLIRAAALAVCFAAGAAGAQDAVYKWVDADGVPHYSDQPPMGVSGSTSVEAMDIRVRRTNPGAVQARVREREILDEAADIRERQEAGEAADAAAERERVLAERRSSCEQAKERASKYANARRLYKPGPDGERIYLSDEEIDAERASALRAVDEWCSE